VTFPMIPQTTDECLEQIAREYLLTEKAPEINELEAEALLKNPQTWGRPYEVAIRLDRIIGKAGTAYVVSNPGVLIEVLGDNMQGFVIAYSGSIAGDLKAEAYLVIRPSGLEWHAPLTPERSFAALATAAQAENAFVKAHLSEMEPVETLLEDLPSFFSVELTHSQRAILGMLKYDTWDLKTIERDPGAKAQVFAGIHLRLIALLKDIGVQIEDIVDAVQNKALKPRH
jgi:hypothetical protein